MSATGSAEPIHMWRLVTACFGGPVEAVYACELCSERLEVPTGGVHPVEC